jgi:L-ascorbate metabolism protein UlaG (beta-lactamase superfamily)
MRERNPQETEAASPSGELAITWLGHATVLVEMDGTRVLTDPLLRRRPGLGSRVAPISPLRVPVDAVLLSDLHRVHTDLPTLRGVARTGPLIVPPPAREWLTARGIQEVHELAPLQTMTLGRLAITAVRGRHDPRRHPFGPSAQPLGFLLANSLSVYFAGDTAALPEMADLRGRVDVALLPIGRSPAWLGHRFLDPEEAAAAAALINPSVAIPIDWSDRENGFSRRRMSDRAADHFATQTRRYAPLVDVRVLARHERVVL